MPTDVLSSGLLRTTGLAWPVQPSTHKAPSVLHPTALAAALLASVGHSPPAPSLHLSPCRTDNLWAGCSISQECLLPPDCPLQMEAQQRQGRHILSFTVGYLGVSSQVYSPPYPDSLPLKCPHGAGSEPRLPVRVRCGWNSPTFSTQNICAHPMTLPEGRSRYDFGLNTLELAGTLMQCVGEDTLTSDWDRLRVLGTLSWVSARGALRGSQLF